MKYSEARQGRIFVIRLETGDRLPDTIEKFASEHNIQRGMCIIVGGVGPGSLVVGPEDSKKTPVIPMLHEIKEVHEIAGVGTIFPDGNGMPKLHMHAALGRKGNTLTGCVRKGVDIWNLGEVILLELTDNSSFRKKDSLTGFEFLEPANG